jgi:hypothetical protein
MFSIKLPTTAAGISIGYMSFFPLAFAFLFFGWYMHTSASMLSGAFLAIYVGFLCSQLWLHITAFPKQIYQVEWLFMGIALAPMPLWLYTLFFASVNDDKAACLVLPALTYFIAMRLPSPKCPQERVPVWQKRTLAG